MQVSECIPTNLPETKSGTNFLDMYICFGLKAGHSYKFDKIKYLEMVKSSDKLVSASKKKRDRVKKSG